jgi:hypothetical protein
MVTNQTPARGTEPPDPEVVHTGSISSTVDLDYVSNLAHKVYHPSAKVRLLYWLAFQAPFPYVANHGALEAARQRRVIVDVLTKYWFGHHLVARVVDIEDTADGGHDFITQLVRGNEPARKRRAWRFLKLLDRKFLESGLPTWQVTPYNPHAITNFIERADGTFRIIDLESSLVAVLFPVTGIWRLMRRGLFPSFDDIDVIRLREYIRKHASDIEATLTDANVREEYGILLDAIDRYEAAANDWYASEPRYLTRFLQAFVRLVETPLRWVR